MKPLICFDLDNTLVYSERVHVNSYNYALKKILNKTQNPKLITKLLGRPHKQIVKILTKDAPKEKVKDIMSLHDKILIKKFYHLARPIPGIISTLKEFICSKITYSLICFKIYFLKRKYRIMRKKAGRFQ